MTTGGAARGRIGILISGRGSNMLSIARACREGRIPADVALVISNLPDAPGLERAAALGIETLVIEKRGAGRREHDMKVVAALRAARVDLVCLAGYMRLLSADFIREFPGRILNIHPGLLPAFPGLHAQRQAVEYGVRWSGATVHFVDEGLDSGPIVLQAAVPVEPGDTEETLSARILDEEHRLYPEAVRLYFEGRLRIEGRKVRITG
ncbi:MAG TPA: phosphoribosylglycinamide formyltransferase [Candidatus Saccharimonadales bacterium]|nr:phosphoribosylglycinamide formyltransferase [Candidatus Saccharimonadales bacterium]